MQSPVLVYRYFIRGVWGVYGLVQGLFYFLGAAWYLLMENRMCEIDVCCFFHGGGLNILIYHVISWRGGFFIPFCVGFLYLILWCSIKIYSKIAPLPHPQLFLTANNSPKLTYKKLNYYETTNYRIPVEFSVACWIFQ